MRPDDHKRRKNEKYKKKHGISCSNSTDKGSKKSENENEGSKSSKSGKSDAKDHKLLDARKDPNTLISLHLHNLASVKPRDDPGVKDEAVARRLPDNWERYEEDEDEEDDRFMPEMRGEDFNKLISESGGSSSRFRFKDEEDWADVSESEKSYNQDVSLNFDNLALALDCIPLCERLGISTDLFTANQVEEMTRNGIDCKSRYNETLQMQISERMPTKEQSSNIIEGKINAAENKTARKNESVTKFTTKTDGKSKSAEKSNYNIHGYVNSKKKDGLDDLDKSEQSEKTVNGDTKKADISSLEDDLDSLLSFDLPSTITVVDDKKSAIPKPASPVVPKPVTVTNSSSNSTDDFLDELLADQ